MPEMSPFGWFHTIMGMAALLSGAYSILRYKIIESENASAKIFLLTTVITSVSALMYTNKEVLELLTCLQWLL